PPDPHGGHHRLLPMAIRLLLDRQGHRICIAVVAAVPRHLLPRRRPVFGRPTHRQGVLIAFPRRAAFTGRAPRDRFPLFVELPWPKTPCRRQNRSSRSAPRSTGPLHPCPTPSFAFAPARFS